MELRAKKQQTPAHFLCWELLWVLSLGGSGRTTFLRAAWRPPSPLSSFVTCLGCGAEPRGALIPGAHPAGIISFLPIHLPRNLHEPPLLSSPQYLSPLRGFKNRRSSWFVQQDPVLCPEGWERTFFPHFSLTSNLCHKILGSGRVIRAGGAGIFFNPSPAFIAFGAGAPNSAADVELWGGFVLGKAPRASLD